MFYAPDQLLTLWLMMGGGMAFLGVALGLAWLLSPSRPNAVKNMPYESGEKPVGSAHGKFDLRFYAVALLFLLFDVEIVLLYPLATVYGDVKLNAMGKLWGWLGLAEMVVFITVLALGLAYAWARGFLSWTKHLPAAPEVEKPLPTDAYARYSGGGLTKPKV